MTQLPGRVGRYVAVAAGATALTTTLAMVPAVAHDSAATPVVQGLDGPRGVAVLGHGGRVVYAEADGSVSMARLHDGAVTATTLVGQVPASFIAPNVAVGPHGRVYALTPGGPPGTGATTLYRLRRGHDPKVVADIGAYQQTDPDPFNLADSPTESNPFGIAVLSDGSVLVSDAAANDLLRVWPRSGKVVTVARLKPRVVTVPEGLPAQIDGPEGPIQLPPAGTMVPSEDVATSVTVGADGFYYVGELRGVPATPGTSQVWRIRPDSVNALCDPDHPHRGACQRYADGFTSIVDLAAGRDGSIYVVELVQRSWLQWQAGLVDPPVGGLFRITPRKHVRELAAGALILPGGVDVARKGGGAVFVTSPVFGPGAVSRVSRH